VDPIQELIELEAIKKVRRLYWDADAMTGSHFERYAAWRSATYAVPLSPECSHG
jgi:hypothetical protein